MNHVIETALVLICLALSGGLTFAAWKAVQFRHAYRELVREREVIYGFIQDIGDFFGEAEHAELEPLLNRILVFALRTTRAEAGIIYMVGDDGQVLEAKAVAGIIPPITVKADPAIEKTVKRAKHLEDLVLRTTLAGGEGLVGEVAATGQRMLIDDAALHPRVPHYDSEMLFIDSMMLVPMRFSSRTIGVMVTTNRSDGMPFTEGDLNKLQALADQSSVSIHYAGLRESLEAKSLMDHDLGMARHIQTSLLPRTIPEVPKLELAAFNLPAREIGGDYYDFLELDDDHLGIAVADVSGKGITGAMVMSICRSVLRAQSASTLRPAEMLKSLNRVLSQDISEDMFISVLYMVLDTRNQRLTVARAGHEKPLFKSQDKRSVDRIDSAGIAIGLAPEDVFDESIDEVEVDLRPGDVVVAYTDGITEAMNSRREEWGQERFLEAINIASAAGAGTVLDNIQQRLHRFVGDCDQYDDMTLIALRVLS